MTTNGHLTKIKARAEAATRGPWGWGQGDLCHLGGFVAGPPIHYEAVWANRASDAKFIAHSRTDVPALVAALEAVLTQTADMREVAATGYSDRTTRLILESWADEIETAINEALGEDQ